MSVKEQSVGLNVTRQDEHGRLLGSTIGDPRGVLARLLPREDDASYPLLRYVDLYGDTVFNRLQMEGFLQEWNRLKPKVVTDGAQYLWAAVEELALAVQNEPHTYLKFIGD